MAPFPVSDLPPLAADHKRLRAEVASLTARVERLEQALALAGDPVDTLEVHPREGEKAGEKQRRGR